MRILAAVDSFKGTLTSAEIASVLQKTLLPAKVAALSVSDGGEGLLDSLKNSLHLKVKTVTVTGPLFAPVRARYGVNSKGLLVIEMSEASGLTLVPQASRNPLYTTTYGCGELLALASDKKIKRILMGIGGSATCDGAAGALSALGVEINPSAMTGSQLQFIKSIKLPEKHFLQQKEFIIACDAQNPLTGKNGAVKMYAPQKGAGKKDVRILEAGMENWRKILHKKTKKDLNKMPGSGAAGGIGGALSLIFGARMMSGINLVLQEIAAEKAVRKADLIITGEGCVDASSFHGKTLSGITALARKYNKPVWVICGSCRLSAAELKKNHIRRIFQFTDYLPLHTCLSEPHKVLKLSAGDIKKALEL